MKLKILTLFLLLTFSLSQTPDEKPVAIEDLYFVDGHYLSSYKREIDSFNQGFGPIKALLNKQIAYDKDFNETKSVTFVEIRINTYDYIYITKKEILELIRVIDFLDKKSLLDKNKGFINETTFSVKRIDSLFKQNKKTEETFESIYSDSIVKLIDPYDPTFNKLVCNIGYKITYAKSNIGQGYRLNWYLNHYMKISKISRFRELLDKCLIILDNN